MNDVHTGRALIRWWAILVVGAAAALLIAWLARISGVPMRTVLSIAAGALALGWLIVLVALPWNLYFAARRVVAEIAVSRGRGIAVPHGHRRIQSVRKDNFGDIHNLNLSVLRDYGG